MCNLSTVRCRTISHVNATMIICNSVYCQANDWILEFIRFEVVLLWLRRWRLCYLYVVHRDTFLFNLTTIEMRDATQMP